MISINTIIKRLSLFSLLILAFPFFQTCSDRNLLHNPYLKDNPLEEVTQISGTIKEEVTVGQLQIAPDSNPIKEYHLSFDELCKKKITAINLFNKRKKEMTSNGYELGAIFFQDMSQLLFLPFALAIIVSLLIIYSSYKKKPKFTFVLSVSIFCLLIILLILLYKIGYLEDVAQIKFGYYMFITNLAFISYFSFTQFRNKQNGI